MAVVFQSVLGIQKRENDHLILYSASAPDLNVCRTGSVSTDTTARLPTFSSALRRAVADLVPHWSMWGALVAIVCFNEVLWAAREDDRKRPLYSSKD